MTDRAWPREHCLIQASLAAVGLSGAYRQTNDPLRHSAQ